MSLVATELPLPAYEMVLKASHCFNLLMHVSISVTERQRYILKIRKMAYAIAKKYYATRESLGFPLIKPKEQVL